MNEIERLKEVYQELYEESIKIKTENVLVLKKIDSIEKEKVEQN